MSKFLRQTWVPYSSATISRNATNNFAAAALDVYGVEAPAGSIIIQADMGRELYKVGVFRSPAEWCHEAATKFFPTDSLMQFPWMSNVLCLSFLRARRWT
eukprot:6492407-Amphidinium_carterae.1